jgi:hypothetical protein
MNMVMEYVMIVNMNNGFCQFFVLCIYSDAFDSALLDIEPLFESYDDLSMANAFTDDYTNSYLLAQSRRLSNGKNEKR